jgi:iron-sulfur cluster assembly protein
MPSTQQKPLTISISKGAADHIRDYAKVEGKPRANLRVGVKGGGCSGLTYLLDLVEDEEGRETDKTIEENGLKLFVDKKSYVFLAGTVLEYQGGLNGKGFVFNNPNAKTTCGCGTSFSV